jgi:hypothetical protein
MTRDQKSASEHSSDWEHLTARRAITPLTALPRTHTAKHNSQPQLQNPAGCIPVPDERVELSPILAASDVAELDVSADIPHVEANNAIEVTNRNTQVRRSLFPYICAFESLERIKECGFDCSGGDERVRTTFLIRDVVHRKHSMSRQQRIS